MKYILPTLLIIGNIIILNCSSKLQLGIVKECSYSAVNHIYSIKVYCPKKHKEYGLHSRTLRHIGDSLYFKLP